MCQASDSKNCKSWKVTHHRAGLTFSCMAIACRVLVRSRRRRCWRSMLEKEQHRRPTMAHEEVELEEESRSTILDTSVSQNSKSRKSKNLLHLGNCYGHGCLQFLSAWSALYKKDRWCYDLEFLVSSPAYFIQHQKYEPNKSKTIQRIVPWNRGLQDRKWIPKYWSFKTTI